MSWNRQSKGVTLLTLVITIVVMLIIAGATITVLFNGGLFSQGETAIEEARAAQADEQATAWRLAARDGMTNLTAEEKIADMHERGLLTDEDVDYLLDEQGRYKENTRQIGVGRYIHFRVRGNE